MGKDKRIEEVDVPLNRWLLAYWAFWSNLEWVYKTSRVEHCRDNCAKALLPILGSGDGSPDVLYQIPRQNGWVKLGISTRVNV
jgi:hypothetical protein